MTMSLMRFCKNFDVDDNSGGRSHRLKSTSAAAESSITSILMTTARESIFDTALSGPRPIVSILVLWTDCARRHFASILRRVLQEGFQVVGLKLHVTATAVVNSLGSSVCNFAYLHNLWIIIIILTVLGEKFLAAFCFSSWTLNLFNVKNSASTAKCTPVLDKWK